METTTNATFKKPFIDIVAIRNMIESDTINQDDAERIALAIDASIRAQDTSGNATKGDLKELELKLDTRFESVYTKIAESQKSIIIWVAGLMFTQTILAVLLKKVIG